MEALWEVAEEAKGRCEGREGIGARGVCMNVFKQQRNRRGFRRRLVMKS